MSNSYPIKCIERGKHVLGFPLCNKEYLLKCIVCGEHVWRSDAVEYKGSYYCPECAEKKEEQSND